MGARGGAGVRGWGTGGGGAGRRLGIGSARCTGSGGLRRRGHAGSRAKARGLESDNCGGVGMREIYIERGIRKRGLAIE